MAAVQDTLSRTDKVGFLDSSVGKKVVMAITGTILFGFVAVHMLGNTQAYMGPKAFNAYAELLHGMLHGMGIWAFRGVMLVAVAVHVWAAISLTLANWAARPKGYRAQQLKAANWGSRTMRWTGAFLAMFIVYHLLHLTTGHAHPAFVKGEAYANFVAGFRSVGASSFYIVGMLCLGLHLWHGIWSLTQTFGWSHPTYDALRRRIATVATVVIIGGNISFPIAVLMGVIK